MISHKKDNSWAHLQRTQVIHGDESKAIRRVFAKIQGRETARKGEDERTR